MTPGEVLDEIIRDERITHFRTVEWGERNQCADVIGMFDVIMDYMRGDNPQHLPLSPVEVDRLRVALRTITDAVNAAHARKPAHFYVVQKGGR